MSEYTYMGNPYAGPFYDFAPAGSDDLTVVFGGNVQGDRKTPNPIHFAKTRRVSHSGTYSVTQTNGIRLDVHGTNCAQSQLPAIGFDDGVYNTALGRMWDQYRNASDLSVDAFQMGQTRKMVSGVGDILRHVRSYRRDPFTNLVDAFQNFARWRRGGGSYSRALANKWLEFQYGWRPMASTIYDAAVELARHRPSVMVVKGRASNSERREYARDAVGIPLLRERGIATIRHRCEFKCRFKPPLSDAQLLGNFTSLNPVSIVWELTPFSFVVDWVYDVGGTLRALENAVLYGSTFVDGYVTEGVRVDIDNRIVGQASGGGYREVIASTSASNYALQKRRSVLGGTPFPRPPRFKFDLGSERCANAAALLRQLMR